MPRYDIVCAICGDREIIARMDQASTFMPCDLCHGLRPQRIHVPHFQEDRTHMWKGPMGNGWSTALGAYMPSSRAERDRLAKKKGVEFCTVADLKADSPEAKEALDYHAQVQAGGPREEWAPNPHADSWKATPAWSDKLK